MVISVRHIRSFLAETNNKRNRTLDFGGYHRIFDHGKIL
jgi:hypothetical protein